VLRTLKVIDARIPQSRARCLRWPPSNARVGSARQRVRHSKVRLLLGWRRLSPPEQVTPDVNTSCRRDALELDAIDEVGSHVDARVSNTHDDRSGPGVPHGVHRVSRRQKGRWRLNLGNFIANQDAEVPL